MKTDALYNQLTKALAKFNEALTFPDTEPLRESLIQRFEYTFELSWKLMNSALNDEGMPRVGVRTILRAAAHLQLIKDPARWLEFADARNQTSHMYLEGVAINLANIARQDFAQEVEALLAEVRDRNSYSL